MMPRLTRFTKALLVVAALAVAGCASFPANRLSKQSYYGLTSTQPKAVVDYDVIWTSSGERDFIATYWFSEQVKSVFEKSEIFASHTLGGASAPLHFSVKMENSADHRAAKLAGIVSGLSLTLIPVFITEEFSLTIAVRSGNREVKKYAYNDQMMTWFQFLLLFAFSSHAPREVRPEVAENMLLHFLHDAQKEGVFSQADRSVSARGGTGHE